HTTKDLRQLQDKTPSRPTEFSDNPTPHRQKLYSQHLFTPVDVNLSDMQMCLAERDDPKAYDYISVPDRARHLSQSFTKQAVHEQMTSTGKKGYGQTVAPDGVMSEGPAWVDFRCQLLRATARRYQPRGGEKARKESLYTPGT
ncbi:hypothetical protein MMC29_005641, partial [Sticta canariensis]|nr:hypothetical protein [Sticta canariensis]